MGLALASLAKDKSSLLVMATGLGKTVVFAEIIRRLFATGRGGRVLVLAHREELVFQAQRTIERVANIDVGIEMGDYRVNDTISNQSSVVISTVQTQNAGSGNYKRMMKFECGFRMIVVDEAHHAISDSYRSILDYHRSINPEVRILGVTATPDRCDEVALGEVFNSCSFEFGIREGIESGYLVPIRQRMIYVEGLDFSQCRTTAGDLNAGDLSRVVEYEETLHGMISPTIEIVGTRRCLVFAVSVAHADRVCEILNRHRAGCAVTVNGKTNKDLRREIFRAFADGTHQFLVNVGVATEGWDDPATDGRGVQVIAVMRPTKSRSLYSQMIGRGTRCLPSVIDDEDDAGNRIRKIQESDKPSVEIIDFCGNAGRHKLVHCSDALGGKDISERCVRIAEERIARSAEAVDVLSVLTLSERQENNEIQQKKRRGILGKAKYSSYDIDPFSVVSIAPDREANWEKNKPATEKQIEFLHRLCIDIPYLCTINEAKKLIDFGVSTPSPKQAWVLRSHGLDPENFNRKSASEAIDRLKKGKEL